MTGTLVFFPRVRQAGRKAPLVASEIASLKVLESSIAPFITIGSPEFLEALETMLLTQAERARQLAVERRNKEGA